MNSRRAWVRSLILASWFFVFGVEARVERFAVIIGNNLGAADEGKLRYAQTDARRVYDVLRELGSFEPVNMVTLLDEDANALRQTLIAVNDRIRAAQALPNTEAMLFVYYSGHADADALHLGGTQLAIAEIAQLVRGSSANVRLLVLDACQSGALTRAKGGRVTAPFAIPQDPGLPGQGLALLTASAAHEDAQESDQLQGSFFTHAFVSGLLGAADRDRDGRVVLEEAYQHAYEGTLRATSSTRHGTQHPTFSYELRGQGQLVLTQPFAGQSSRGVLTLPVGESYLVLRDGPEGAVVAEIGREDDARSLSLTSGRYFVRGRSDGHLLEGHADVRSGQTSSVDSAKLTRIEYAHLVRKGQSSSTLAHGVELGGLMRSTLPNAETPCFGGFLGYRLDATQLSWSVRIEGCTSQMENASLRTRTEGYGIAARLAYVRDLSPRVALELGIGGGPALFTQHFETRGRAPSRISFAGQGELFLGLSTDLTRGVYAVFDLSVQSYVLRMLDAEQNSASLRAAFAGRCAAGIGKRF